MRLVSGYALAYRAGIIMPIVPLGRLPVCHVEWLWPGHLPLGHVVMLDADPKTGKSLVTLDLCARDDRKTVSGRIAGVGRLERDRHQRRGPRAHHDPRPTRRCRRRPRPLLRLGALRRRAVAEFAERS